MQTGTIDRPEQTCQWCGGSIPADGDSCLSCGAIRPRDDLLVPGLTQKEQSQLPEPVQQDITEDDEAAKARQILRDMDAYVSEAPAAPAKRRDPADDLIVIIVVLVVGALVGGLTGWLLAPPLLHQLFENVVGVESDGPEAFRRLGAFIGALIAMLFAALLATMLRR